MASYEFRVNGAKEIIAALTEGAERITPLVEVAVRGVAVELKTSTQRNATGRPGPNAPTADYIASWRDEPTERRKDLAPKTEAVSRSVYSDAVQAHRLEFGYVGDDSSGRHVDAPPFPHMWPAIEAVTPLFHAAMEQVAEQAVRW